MREPQYMKDLLDLHKDRPMVQKVMKEALERMWLLEYGDADRNMIRFTTYLNTFRYCGDFKIQHLVIKRFLVEEDVRKYKHWFAEVWFGDVPRCVPLFTSLKNEDEDVALFVHEYNSSQVLQFVCSIPCSFILWNNNLLPARNGPCFMTINCGTKTIGVFGIKEIPKVMQKRRMILLKASTITSARVHSVKSSFGSEQALSIQSAEGQLVVHPSPPLDAEGWKSVGMFLGFIGDICIEFDQTVLTVTEKKKVVNNSLEEASAVISSKSGQLEGECNVDPIAGVLASSFHEVVKEAVSKDERFTEAVNSRNCPLRNCCVRVSVLSEPPPFDTCEGPRAVSESYNGSASQQLFASISVEQSPLNSCLVNRSTSEPNLPSLDLPISGRKYAQLSKSWLNKGTFSDVRG